MADEITGKRITELPLQDGVNDGDYFILDNGSGGAKRVGAKGVLDGALDAAKTYTDQQTAANAAALSRLIVVDTLNGNDATATGSWSRPYWSPQAAWDANAARCTSWQTAPRFIIINDCAYVGNGTRITINQPDVFFIFSCTGFISPVFGDDCRRITLAGFSSIYRIGGSTGTSTYPDASNVPATIYMPSGSLTQNIEEIRLYNVNGWGFAQNTADAPLALNKFKAYNAEIRQFPNGNNLFVAGDIVVDIVESRVAGVGIRLAAPNGKITGIIDSTSVAPNGEASVLLTSGVPLEAGEKMTVSNISTPTAKYAKAPVSL